MFSSFFSTIIFSSEHLTIWVYSKPCFRVLFTEDLIDQVKVISYQTLFCHISWGPCFLNPLLPPLFYVSLCRKAKRGVDTLFRISRTTYSSPIPMRTRPGLSRYTRILLSRSLFSHFEAFQLLIVILSFDIGLHWTQIHAA